MSDRGSPGPPVKMKTLMLQDKIKKKRARRRKRKKRPYQSLGKPVTWDDLEKLVDQANSLAMAPNPSGAMMLVLLCAALTTNSQTPAQESPGNLSPGADQTMEEPPGDPAQGPSQSSTMEHLAEHSGEHLA